VFADLPLTQLQMSWMLLGERLGDGLLFYRDLVDDTGPLSAGFFFLIDWIFGGSSLAYQIIGRILIFIQVIYWNSALIRYRVFDENTFIPAIVLLSLFHISFDMLSLSPALLGSTFVIFALSQLFSQTILQKESSEATLLIGIYGGLATGFHPIYIVFLPFLIIVGVTISGFSFRQLILSLIGYFTPLLLIVVYYFWSNGLEDFLRIWPLSFTSETYQFHTFATLGILFAFPLVLGFLGYFFGVLSKGASINQQKQRQILFFWAIFAGLAIFISRHHAALEMMVFLPLISYLITAFFLGVKKKLPLQIGFLCLVILLPLGSWWFWAENRSLQSEYFLKESANPKWPGKSVLVLDSDLSLYQNHSMKGPFLNYYLSQELLEKERTFARKVQLFRMINKQMPEVVYDPHGDFGQLLSQFKELERKYKMEKTNVFILK